MNEKKSGDVYFCLYVTALDPARPLIAPGIGNRLDSGDAKSVQVMHTNAGYYGEGGRVGHVDFCNEKLCEKKLEFFFLIFFFISCYF